MLERVPFIGPGSDSTFDDLGWVDANSRWLTKSLSSQPTRSVHSRATRPLVICGHGVGLRVEKGSLIVRDGFTHYPQERTTYRFFRGDLNLPPRIIMLDGSGGLSFDVLTWLAEQNVSLVRADYQGDVVTVIAGSGSAFSPEKVAWQDLTRADPARRLAFCCDLIAGKLRASLTTLRTTLPASSARARAVERAKTAISCLENRAVQTVNDILMIEAGAAARYFGAWRGLPIQWKGLRRDPVPESWMAAGSRRTIRDSRFSTNRNATHPVNAMLNYGYGVLHSQMQVEAVAAGYDPRRGIMHESRPDAQALVLDLMETRRPQVDAAVLRFVAANAFMASDFVIRRDGVCRLAPQLARRLCEAIHPA